MTTTRLKVKLALNNTYQTNRVTTVAILLVMKMKLLNTQALNIRHNLTHTPLIESQVDVLITSDAFAVAE